MKILKVINKENIQAGDIVRIQNLQFYVSEDEVTELVEKFADTTLIVEAVSNEVNIFGERIYTCGSKELGSCTFTDHEIYEAYRINEV